MAQDGGSNPAGAVAADETERTGTFATKVVGGAAGSFVGLLAGGYTAREIERGVCSARGYACSYGIVVVGVGIGSTAGAAGGAVLSGRSLDDPMSVRGAALGAATGALAGALVAFVGSVALDSEAALVIGFTLTQGFAAAWGGERWAR